MMSSPELLDRREEYEGGYKAMFEKKTKTCMKRACREWALVLCVLTLTTCRSILRRNTKLDDAT